MCGIAGIYERGERGVSRAALEAMIAPLRTRGPDADGYFVDGRVGVAHARLSIIDPAGGQQPLYNEDRTVVAVCNGEIFNFRELRAELERAGHRFSTGSDSEVAIHLYEEYGDDFVQRLNGQYAIALWDGRRRRLLLIRDRVGILPLFYAERDGRVLFASEVKGLLPLFGEAPRLDRQALDQLMTFWAPTGGRTMFEGVHEVSPGSMLILDERGLTRRQYWDWSFPADGEWATESEAQLTEQLHDLLVDATRLRLHADVPVGAYLSGGLDSSALAALVRHHGESQLRTFSIGFSDGGLDETDYQHLVATHLGTQHSSVRCSEADVAARFPDSIWRTESPVLRTAPVPMGMLSQSVREQGYKVVLTGEGADEVLGGYDLFKEAKIRQFWARQPDSQLRPLLLQRLYPYLNINERQGQAYLQQFFGAGLTEPDAAFFSHLPRWMTTARCKTFFSEQLKASLGEEPTVQLERTLPAQWRGWHPFNRAQYLEVKTLLSGYLLAAQGDRMQMGNAVEGRFPFLDHRLIEFAARLPPRLKMKVLNEKYLFKRAVERYLPPAIVRRPKQPYRAPDIPAFFSAGEPDYVRELLSEAALRDYGYFDPRRVGLLLKKIRRGGAIGYKDNMALVGILSTQLWHYLFIDNYHRRFGKSAAASWHNTSPGGLHVDTTKGSDLHPGELPLHGRSSGSGR